jgi:hypothetical protein
VIALGMIIREVLLERIVQRAFAEHE